MSAVLKNSPSVAIDEPCQSPQLARMLELQTLLSEVAAGQQRALERFYRLTMSRIYGKALFIVRCPATAEEVVEDVYVQIWHQAGSYDPGRSTPLTWALTICRSRSIDALRRVDACIVDPDPAERVDAIAQHAPGAQELLQTSQDHAALHAAINRLTPTKRQLLALAFFRGLSHSEIATTAQIPLGTVKTQIRQAIATLRSELVPD